MPFNPQKPFIVFSILLAALSACNFPGRNSENLDAVERTDSCSSNPAHSYELYIPPRNKTQQDLPLLVAIDPHGAGYLAMDRLKESVTEYPAVLAASNLIQNNDPDFVRELDELIADIKSRYPVGEHTWLAGFSGGARMALAYAVDHSVDGVIASGAFTGPGQLSAIKCPIMGLIGMDDFNFLETARYILDPASLPSGVHIELIRASHAWPGKDRLTSVFAWFRLADNSNRRYGRQQVRQYVREQQVRIDSLVNAGDLIQAACISRNMASVKSFEKTGSFISATAGITNKETYRQQLSQLEESLRFETRMRQIYDQALMEENETWWKREITALHEKMTSETGGFRGMACKRLGGFIGIACYSLAQQFAGQKDIPKLRQVLMVYRLAEPDNPDMQHFGEVLEDLETRQ